MASYQCTICGKITEIQPQKCCAPDKFPRYRNPFCCGKAMIEIID